MFKEDRILLLKGQSHYNVLRRAADEIAVGFKNRGYEVIEMDMALDDDTPMNLMKEIQKQYAFIFSCQALGFEEESFSSVSPCIGWIFDDVLYHFDRVQGMKYGNRYLLTVDEEMCAVSQQMFPGIKNISSLLHGGFESKKELKKDIDVLFPCSIWEPPRLENIIPDPMPVEKLFAQRTIEVLEESPELSVRKALEIALNGYGEDLTSNLLLELTGVIYYVDTYIRSQCKHKILRTLLENNIPVHIVGDGYDQFLKAYKGYATVCNGKDIDDVIDLMQRAKIVINPVPPVFLKGAHERIFSAMLNKAACFTPYSDYLKEKLDNHLEYIDFNHLQNMISRIQNILDNYEMYSKQVLEDNYRYASTEHTWQRKGEQIVDFYEDVVLGKAKIT